jgi:hypothetical protein
MIEHHKVVVFVLSFQQKGAARWIEVAGVPR